MPKQRKDWQHPEVKRRQMRRAAAGYLAACVIVTGLLVIQMANHGHFG